MYNRVEDIRRPTSILKLISIPKFERNSIQEMQKHPRLSYVIQQRRVKTSSYGKMLLVDASGRQAPAIPRMSFTFFLE